MRLFVHIGLEHVGASRLQDVLAAKREQLLTKGILYPRSAGNKNHTRLFMAVTDADHVDPLRHNRGYTQTEDQQRLYESVARGLAQEIATHRPHTMILSASQLGASLARPSEIARLHDLLSPLSQDIRILAHVDEQARLLARHYGAQVMEGRAASLELELDMAGSADWWDDALLDGHVIDPDKGQYQETQCPAFWLDYPRLVHEWETVFGADSVTLRPYDAALFYGETVTREICESFDLDVQIGRADSARPPAQPSAVTVARARQMNALLLRLLARSDRLIPRKLWKSLLEEVTFEAPPIPAGSLSAVSDGFAAANAQLCRDHPALSPANFTPDTPSAPWVESPTQLGYRASQYLLAFMGRIDRTTRSEKRARREAVQETGASQGTIPGLSPETQAIMPPLAAQNFAKLQKSSFKPHNRLGKINEDVPGPAYPPAPDGTNTLIVGCMKNEAPYIVEWVAYHRAIGVKNFLIYTNDCSDGTDQILHRLQEMGVLQHRNNDDWSGNSPQQFALDNALKEPALQQADWIAHIDVDEFINIRCGDGTLRAFFKAVPDATNVAMTWRLFGHSGVHDLADRFVIEQFDRCAPKFCPKPHTVWGFKTLFRNTGAYGKLSCHRPNKLDESAAGQVKWVNGSGQDMTQEALKNGWRSSKKSIGYDLIQLNHYALRSAESFLIKRQRGRALHVDRSIGLNYWIRMDWNDHRDLTIQRNILRLRAEYDRLMADDTLSALHRKGLAWHRAKADELHAMPEFQELYDQARALKLNQTERVAWALALDMES
ncbi:glycosyltransferase family 2 protein [Thalassobius sp. S69A]|uniref:glycosyltransferase family 2 protein n=1 Tax=unclassified Thalassovita TaxID=2619711 RepID=UPI000C5C4A01|nr:glycosyl transferase family 2 [Paracoccaceae bacterium]